MLLREIIVKYESIIYLTMSENFRPTRNKFRRKRKAYGYLSKM